MQQSLSDVNSTPHENLAVDPPSSLQPQPGLNPLCENLAWGDSTQASLLHAHFRVV